MALKGLHADLARIITRRNWEIGGFWPWKRPQGRQLTGMRRIQVVLIGYLDVQDVLNLVVNLLGFRLLHKNVAIVRLQKRERNLANLKLLVLQMKSQQDPDQIDGIRSDSGASVSRKRLTSLRWVSMWISVKAFSKKSTSRPEGTLYELNLLSCMLASCAKANAECWNPTAQHKRSVSTLLPQRRAPTQVFQ